MNLVLNSIDHSLITIIIVVVIIVGTVNSQLCGNRRYDDCGNNVYMDYPFWQLELDTHTTPELHCGYPGLGFYCSNGRPTLNISNDLYYVEEFRESSSLSNDLEEFQESSSLRIVNQEFMGKNCPRPRRNFTLPAYYNIKHSFFPWYPNVNMNFTLFFNCTVPPPLSPDDSSAAAAASDHASHNISCLKYNDTLHSYGYLEYQINSKLLQWASGNCEESVVVSVVTILSGTVNLTPDYSIILQRGFRLYWKTPIVCQSCENSGGQCIYNETKRKFNCTCSYDAQNIHDGEYNGGDYCFIPRHDAGGLLLETKIMIGVFTGYGGLIVLRLLFNIYLKNRTKREGISTPNVELFLESYGCLSLQRYKYKDIKKMTNSFKDKLGQGGYGSVFKGMLVDGHIVAVKILVNDPKKSTGEDFINEVATIGRTNHVNIVTLLGFCSSGSKRALVYEFMPNGSLEKFIYKEKEMSNTINSTTTNATVLTTVNAKYTLGREQLYQIALGIARGLEYSHRGCNTRILHFDIKPHNILLDENFCPKISDFGLAKLCPTRESLVSMLGGGRGTIGYIAPEVYDRNFGRVSYKSDVYSYGKMVLEMVGGRKNIDPFAENTSEIYFPHWIYDRLQEQKDKIEGLLRFEEVFEEEMARKIIMVSLWCIQTDPRNRPTMGRVAEMLEGSIESVQMPPKPFMGSPSSPPSSLLEAV